MAAQGSPKEAELRAAMCEILKSSELTQLTSRIVRSQLEEKFKVDLRPRKKELDSMLMEMIEEEQVTREDNKDDDEKIAKESEDDVGEQDTSSINTKEEEEEEEEEDSEEETEEVEEPSPKKQHVNDEELAWKLQTNERGLRRRQAAKKAPERKVPKSKKSAGENKGERKGTGFSKPMVLSEQLAAVVGVNRMSRSDVVKKMWAIIKERKLEDPKNKRFTICDEELTVLFGRKRIQTFGMMKYLKRHIKDPALIVGDA